MRTGASRPATRRPENCRTETDSEDMSDKATREQDPVTAGDPVTAEESVAAGDDEAVEEAEMHDASEVAVEDDSVVEGDARASAPTGEPGAPPGDDEEVDDGEDSPAELTAELDHLQEEFDDLNDRHLRLAAEFDNYRRRQENQMTQAWGRAQADLVGRLLDVLDDLQRVSALDPADESVTVESIVEGIDLVERKFVRTLLEAGAEVVDPEEGEPFDPERMEAMMRVEDESGERDDQVAAVFQKGYEFKGTLVRPARVSVYKG